ncbi:hypothetical protein [Paramicrobacterium fandaimingii]|uniref:hypothetical protein n=1 Tax=Paramicrobacterium fandaimingii TaxID=2708079 RepID=UPI00141EE726|nr:hypothetical protein [Microbacterium fandaimingii]
MATKAPVSEGYVQRVLAEVEAGQRTAGEEPTDVDRDIAARQIRGDITADEAVAAAIAAASARFTRRA